MKSYREPMDPEELETFLEKYDLKDEDFAELIDVDWQTVKAWLKGTRKINATTARLVRFFDNQPRLFKIYTLYIWERIDSKNARVLK